MKSGIFAAVIISIFFLLSSNVQAASLTDNQTVDANKAWTVSFNTEISFDDLTKQGITVTDTSGNKEDVELEQGQDGSTIIVKAPKGGYKPGENYILSIGRQVHSVDGKTLNSERKFYFNIKIDSGGILDGAKIRSGNLSTDYDIEQALSDVDKFQLNTLNIPVKIEIDSLSSSSMKIDRESEAKAIDLIKRLKDKNINIILEPYPWIAQGEKSETDWKPEDMNAFFLNWKSGVLKTLIDEIAVPYQVAALNIGSNFTNIESEESRWCDTIDYVRTYYKGLVTYRTNYWSTASWAPESITAYKNKLNNKLFSKLNFISIAAYFELTDNSTNTVSNLMSAIESSQVSINGQIRNQNIKQEIKNFYDKWNKPIFFGELGFPKTNGASIHPWNPYENETLNNIEQANCFEAYKREFQNEPWFMGFSVFAIGKQDKDKHYYPSEESREVIRSWYSKDE